MAVASLREGCTNRVHHVFGSKLALVDTGVDDGHLDTARSLGQVSGIHASSVGSMIRGHKVFQLDDRASAASSLAFPM